MTYVISSHLVVVLVAFCMSWHTKKAARRGYGPVRPHSCPTVSPGQPPITDAQSISALEGTTR